MAGKPVGTAFAEISLDATPLERGLKRVNDQLVSGSIKVEDAYKSLGIKSDAVYEQMRKNATAAVDFIKNKTLSSTEEIVRVQQAAANKIKQINEQQYGRQVSMIDTMKKNWLGAIAAATAAYYTISKVTGAYIEEEAAVLRLGVAMKNQGDYTRRGLEAFKDYASAVQKSTAVSDDSVLAVMGNLKSFGMLDSEVKKATQTVLDFAEGAKIEGMTVDTAGKLIGKAYAGNTATLGRYGIVIDKTLTGAAKFDAVLKQLNDRFGGSAQAQMASYGGQWANLKNQIGDLAEYVGLVVLKSIQALSAAGAGLAFPFLWSIEKMLRGLTWLTEKVSYVAGKLGFEGLEASIAKVSLTMKAGADAMKGHADEAKSFAAANMKAAVSGDAVGEMLDKMKSGSRTGKAGGPEVGKPDPAMEHRLREVAKMYAEEGKLVHDALMDEMGMTQEYHDTLRKMDDEVWEEEKRIAEEIVKLDAKRYAEEGAIAMDALAAEMGMTQEYADTVRGIEDDLFKAWKDAHDPATLADFYDSIVGYEQEAYDQKIKLINAERDARIAAGVDAVAAEKKAAQDIGALNQKVFEAKARQVHDALGDMSSAFSAIGSMYEKNSGEYARMQEAAKAMIVLQQAVAVVNAGAAIAAAAAAPFPAGFVAMAAMAAAMGSLLASIGTSFSGGGSAGASAPVLPASTRLGAEAGTGSESASKSYELLKDTYTLEYRELTGIHDSMKELNQNITGLVASVFRTGGAENLGGAQSQSLSWTASSYVGNYAEGVVNSMFLGLLPKMFGDKFGNFISKIFGSVFGGEINSEWVAGGLRVQMQQFADILAGGAVDALNYSIVHVTGGGGLFSGGYDDMRGATEKLDTQTHDLLTLAFKNIGDTLMFLAGEFGVDSKRVRDLVIAAADLNLKDLTGEEATKKISEYFSGIADVATETLFGALLSDYQKLDEGLFETAIRIATNMAVVMETLDATGQHFAGTIPQIIAMSDALVGFAGGLDKLQEAAGTYYDKFFSDAEKQARLQGQLSGALGDMGYALPGDRGGYRALVKGLDLTSTAGQKAYVMLMQFSEKADQYYSVVEDAAGATDKLTESLKKQITTIDKWLLDLNTSSLAPVLSATAFQNEYAKAKATAMAPGATEANTSAFLASASEYLKFARAYGGDYKAIYEAVVADVNTLRDMKSAEVLAIEAASEAAKIAAKAQLEMIGLLVTKTVPSSRESVADIIARGTPPPMGDRVIPNPSPRGGRYIPEYAEGGLMMGPSIGGEAGSEWAVPTYEPQRSRFLETVPPEFWENLRGGGAVSGGDRQIVVEVHSVTNLDGKVIAESTARQIPRNASLTEAIRRVN